MCICEEDWGACEVCSEITATGNVVENSPPSEELFNNCEACYYVRRDEEWSLVRMQWCVLDFMECMI